MGWWQLEKEITFIERVVIMSRYRRNDGGRSKNTLLDIRALEGKL